MVSSEAVPLHATQPHLRPVAGPGNGQGNGQGNGRGCHRRYAPAGYTIVRQYPPNQIAGDLRRWRDRRAHPPATASGP